MIPDLLSNPAEFAAAVKRIEQQLAKQSEDRRKCNRRVIEERRKADRRKQ